MADEPKSEELEIHRLSRNRNSVPIKNLRKVKYPRLTSIVRLWPGPQALLGKEIFWQEKRDGSNVGVWMGKGNWYHVRSRAKNAAKPDLRSDYMKTDEAPKIKEMILDLREKYNDQVVVFGELLRKGKSPTRVEFHEKEEFIVFDIWSSKTGGFLPYILVHQHCYNWDIPVVDLYATSRHITLKGLFKFRDRMLRVAKGKGREGVVGKTYIKNKGAWFFKERLDTPKLDKIPRIVEDGIPQLPQLPEAEILGALDKAFADLDRKEFMDKAKAMPLFAKYVSNECEKHMCSNNEKLFKYYQQKCEDLWLEESGQPA